MTAPYCVCEWCLRRYRVQNAIAMKEWRPLAVIAEQLLDEWERSAALQAPDWISQ